MKNRLEDREKEVGWRRRDIGWNEGLPLDLILRKHSSPKSDMAAKKGVGG